MNKGFVMLGKLEIDRKRDQFYPAWWTYVSHALQSEQQKPLYVVECQNESERQLAINLKPDSIRAKFIISDASVCH